MALVVLPEGTQISGSLGGTTWSHNRYGAYKRNRSVPVNPGTDLQIAIRNLVKALTIGWENILDQPKRDAWEHYAANVAWKNKLGQDVYLTGLNHYVRSNVPRMQCGLERVDDAPTIFNLAAAELTLGATASETTGIVSVTFDDAADWAGEVGGFEAFYMGLPQNGSIKFFGGPWRQLCCAVGEGVAKAKASGKEGKGKVPPASPQECPAVWPFAEKQRIWLRSRIGRADGRLSEFAQVNFLAGNGASADAR